MRLAGKLFRPASPADAIRAGIGMIHQHFMLVPDFTVMENFLLGNPRFGVRGAALQQAQTEVLELCRRLSIDISISRPASSRKHPWLGLRQILRMKKKSRGDKNNEAPRSSQHAGFSLNSKIADLSVGQRQRVEIVKTLLRQCRLLILDEPTAVLAPQEVEELFALLQRLRDEGYATIFISHKIHEVQAVSDRITVLRNGKVSGAFNTAEASIEMIRRAITPVRQAQGKSPSSVPAAAQTKSFYALNGYVPGAISAISRSTGFRSPPTTRAPPSSPSVRGNPTMPPSSRAISRANRSRSPCAALSSRPGPPRPSPSPCATSTSA